MHLSEIEDFLDHQVSATFGASQREKSVNATVNLRCVISQLALCVIDMNDDDDDHHDGAEDVIGAELRQEPLTFFSSCRFCVFDVERDIYEWISKNQGVRCKLIEFKS